jgi:hypothetical protein
MPAVVNRTVGSFSGIMLALGMMACPFSLKNCRKRERSPTVELSTESISLSVYEVRSTSGNTGFSFRKRKKPRNATGAKHCGAFLSKSFESRGKLKDLIFDCLCYPCVGNHPSYLMPVIAKAIFICVRESRIDDINVEPSGILLDARWLPDGYPMYSPIS